MEIDNLNIIQDLTDGKEGGKVEFKQTTGQLERGISLMIDECSRAGIPDPEFHTDGSSVWVVFRYKMETAGQTPDKHPTSTRQVPDKHRPAR